MKSIKSIIGLFGAFALMTSTMIVGNPLFRFQNDTAYKVMFTADFEDTWGEIDSCDNIAWTELKAKGSSGDHYDTTRDRKGNNPTECYTLGEVEFKVYKKSDKSSEAILVSDSGETAAKFFRYEKNKGQEGKVAVTIQPVENGKDDDFEIVYKWGDQVERP